MSFGVKECITCDAMYKLIFNYLRHFVPSTYLFMNYFKNKEIGFLWDIGEYQNNNIF